MNILTCGWCLKGIDHLRSNARWCSPGCSSKAYRSRPENWDKIQARSKAKYKRMYKQAELKPLPEEALEDFKLFETLCNKFTEAEAHSLVYGCK